MKKEFLINLILLVGINLLIKPFYAFGVDLQVQNQVGSEAYGFYFALLNFSYLFQIVSDMGLQQYNSRLISQHPQLLSKYLPHLLLVKGLLALIFIVLSFGVALLLGYGPEQLYLLIFLLFNQILITLTFFLRSNLSGLQFYRLDSLLSALDKLLMIVIMLVLLWSPWGANFEIEWFVYGQSAAFLLTSLIVVLVVYRKINTPIRFRWDLRQVLSLLRQSFPYALAVFLMMAYTRLDGVMLERILPEQEGLYQAGIYGFGYRLLDAFNMIGYLFAGLLLPMYAGMIRRKEPLGDLLKTAIQWMLFLTLSLSFCVSFFGTDLTRWMLDDYSVEAVETLQLLLWSSNAVGLIYVFGTSLTANGSLKIMNRLFAAGLLFNVILNFILIPWYGAWGAALATVCTQGLVGVVEVVLVFWLLPSTRKAFSYWDLLRLPVAMMGLWLLFGAAKFYLTEYLDWRLCLLLAGVAGLAWAERTGFVDLKGMVGMLRSRER